jgi:outer membrane lipoprotein LolB
LTPRRHAAPLAIALTLTLGLLNACATRPSLRVPDFAAHQRLLGSLANWDVAGKIGLRQGDRGSSAQLHWRQREQHYELSLSGPLGMGAVSIQGDRQGVTLRNNKGEFRADNPETLVHEMTGWQIPVSDLRFWARGMPSPDLDIDRQTIDQGRLALLAQGGWTITYVDYAAVGRYSLPSRIQLSRPEAQITLLLKNWRID